MDARLRGHDGCVRQILFFLLFIVSTTPAAAHELKSAALWLDEEVPGRIHLTLKTPVARDGGSVAIVPRLAGGCTSAGEPRVTREREVIVRQWWMDCPSALAGMRVRLEGLDPRTPDAIVIAHLAGGEALTLAVDRHDPEAVLHTTAQSRPAVALSAYLPIGIEHILLGPDHLLFVLGLMLIVATAGRRVGALVAALTAFTVAHSLTLALAVLGIWGLPSGPVEILIAASIVLLAVELADHERRQRAGLPPSLTLRKPWLVAFAFGLLHGFGFAGALAGVGLPEHARGWALLLFNAGVEVGQLLFVAAALLCFGILRHVPRLPAIALHGTTSSPFAPSSPHERAYRGGPVVAAIGGVGAYWLIERTSFWVASLGGSVT